MNISRNQFIENFPKRLKTNIFKKENFKTTKIQI